MTLHPPEQTYLSTCPVCQEQIDVTSLEPFTKLKCPFCGQMVRVRRRFDHFTIVRQIGEGGMSRVFEAEDETLGRRVALKILNRQYSRDATRMEQFRQEALITASITHPNVIKLYSVGYDQGYFYIAMELVGGGSLEQRIRREERLKEGEALRIGHEVAEGLRAAQHLGLIHRDVKPANILFTDTGTAKVVDFGLALFADRGPDRSAEIWATPYYVAPEKVLHNEEDYRSDIFSLGATLFHALTGSPPHKVDTHSIEELRRVKSRRVALEDSGLRFAARTEHVINHMLSFSPEARFSNYEEVVEELRLADGLLNQSGIRWRLFSRRARLIGSVAAAVLLAFFVGWLLGDGRQARTGRKVVKQLTVESGALDGDGVTVKAGAKTTAETFLKARQDMLEGQPSSAQPAFQRLASSDDTRQPTTQGWARFNAALCSIMTSDPKKPKAMQQVEREFRELAALGAKVETINANRDVSAFFVKVGRAMEKGLGIGHSTQNLGFNTQNEEVLGYLAHALAEWHFGNALVAADAMEFFESKLKTIDEAGPQGWLRLYAAIVQRYKRHFEPLRTALKPRQPQTLDEVRAALAEVETARAALDDGKTGARLSLPGPFLDQVAQTVKNFQRQIADIKRTQQQVLRTKEDELRKADLEQLKIVNGFVASLAQGYDYTPVLDLLARQHFDTRDVSAALEGRRYLYTNARDFISRLQSDLRSTPWSGTLTRRTGGTITGSVSVDTSTVTAGKPAGLLVKVESGTVSVPLDAIKPESLIELAQHFTAQITDSTDYYLRQEMMLAFARVAGLHELSTTLAAQLMQENRAFSARWTKVTEAGI